MKHATRLVELMCESKGVITNNFSCVMSTDLMLVAMLQAIKEHGTSVLDSPEFNQCGKTDEVIKMLAIIIHKSGEDIDDICATLCAKVLSNWAIRNGDNDMLRVYDKLERTYELQVKQKEF